MLHPPTYRPCPACDATQASPVATYSRDKWVVAACDACDFVFLRNPPDNEALQEDFAWEKTCVVKKAKDGFAPALNLARRAAEAGFSVKISNLLILPIDATINALLSPRGVR